MEVPKDKQVYELTNSWVWFDEHGIMYSVSKPNPTKLTKEQSEKELDKFTALFGNGKKCMLIDAKYAKPNTPAERKQAAEILPRVTIAMAVIIHNPLGRMVINLFIGLEKPNYPMKLFKPGEEQVAIEWLKDYLPNERKKTQ